MDLRHRHERSSGGAVGYSPVGVALQVFGLIRVNRRRDETSIKQVSWRIFLLSGTLPTVGGGATTTVSDQLTSIKAALAQRDQMIATVAKVIADLKTFLPSIEAATNIGDTGRALTVGINSYENTLRPDFLSVQNFPKNFPASDMAGGSCVSALSSPAPDSLSFRIAAVQALIAEQIKEANDAITAARTANDSVKLAAAQDSLTELNAQNQTASGYAAVADPYKCQGAGAQALSANLATIQFWNLRLQSLGFGYDPANPTAVKPTASIFSNKHLVSCGGLFNVSQTNTFSVSASDVAPTLDGSSATTAGNPQSFFTVTCSSPIAVSAGVEISGIPDQEYQIVKSVPPSGVTTSVPEFGYVTNSPVHLIPIALAHARLAESQNHTYAGYFSVGVSGNLQGQSSGGSTAEFLIGPSISLFRTIFITGGVHIGYKSVLAGGFKVGDPVPTDITAPQVYKSVAVRYGFAITFAKP